MKLIVIKKKKSCKKASLKVHAFVSATGMYINLIPAKDKGQRGRGGGGGVGEGCS